MCKKCKNGLDLEDLGLETFDLKSKAMSVNTELEISLDIRQNEYSDENGHFFYGDGAYIQACFNTGGIGIGVDSEFLISKPVKITYCPFCGEKITKKDFWPFGYLEEQDEKWNGHTRSSFSYKKNGNYAYNYECCLKENEKSPYRRADDSCEKGETMTKTKGKE